MDNKSIKIYTIGGFNEVGKNMTAVHMGEDVILFDAGLHLPAVIELQEEEKQPTERTLRKHGAIPDDISLDRLGLRNKVRAVLLGHAHLDHIGAIPHIGYRYNAPIVGTHFTIAVLKKILEDDRKKIPNQLKSIPPNSTFLIKGKSGTYKAEFINITHSTLQTAMVALHTPKGIILYANDFKLDNHPIMGLPPNWDALKRISKQGVKALIVDSLYSGTDRKTPSEKVARSMVEEVLLTVDNEKAGIIVSTFSSHIARLKSIVDYSSKLNRKIYFVGRSLKKYVGASIDVGMCPFKDKIQMGSYRNQVDKILKKVNKNRTKSIIVCTGHQGEPNSILDRLVRKKLPFEFKPNDNVIFASKTIPTPMTIANKGQILKRLKKAGTRIFDDVHVSGHPGREDLRDLVSLVNPEHIIPAHGSTQQLTPMIELAREMGYRIGKECHLMQDGQKLEL